MTTTTKDASQVAVFHDERDAIWFPRHFADRLHVQPRDAHTHPERSDRAAGPPYEAFTAANWAAVLDWRFSLSGWDEETWLFGSLLLSASAIPEKGKGAVIKRWKTTRYPQHRADIGSTGPALLQKLPDALEPMPESVARSGAAMLAIETSHWLGDRDRFESSLIRHRLGWVYAQLDLAGFHDDWNALREHWLARHPRSKHLKQHFHDAAGG